MSILVTMALAASGATLPQCSWDKPGVNPFMGDVVAAVDRYQDIPAATRAKLKARMQKRSYDEMVTITRESINGQAEYSPQIKAMHFGQGSVCGSVTRARWTDQMQERGLVYCEDGECILVPTVCRNVSRIKRTKQAAAPAAATNVASSAREGEDPQALLEMEPTGAGVPGAGAPATVAGSGPSFSQVAALPSGQPVAAGPSLPGSFTGGGLTPPPGGGLGGIPPLPPGVTTPVPEPETWALMLAGLAAIGWVARRRRA